MGRGVESIDDAGELRRVRRQAMAIHVAAILAAAALTAGLYLI